MGWHSFRKGLVLKTPRNPEAKKPGMPEVSGKFGTPGSSGTFGTKQPQWNLALWDLGPIINKTH
jgi:hypothetical protein